MIHPILAAFIGTTLGVLLLAALLHLFPRLGGGGRAIAAACTRAPGLDVLVTLFTIVPGVAGLIVAGWWGLLASIAGQIVAMHVWIVLHELAHRDAVRGPRILKVLNSRVGRFRNHFAIWITAVAVPVFWLVRLVQWIVYPALVGLVRFPWYNQGEWVNVSRQKFDGLVGWDLIWCLYCDWMTGIWCLGTEMLRNLESWWCPIRFDSEKKCENCRIDFPDIDGGWVDAKGSMAEVAAALETRYPPVTGPDTGRYSWFGHPDRVTVEGKPQHPVEE